MDIGLGLPSTIPGVEPATVLRWAIDAEERGFASIGVVDRLVYPNLDPMTMLAAAAVVTTGVRLVTGVLVTPIRSNFPAFAKQTATIDRLSGGRLVLGLGVGNREDDFSVAGLDFHRRGRSFDAQLEEITSIWRGDRPELGPEPSRAGGPQLLFGGTSEQAFSRMTRYGAGWFASTSTGEGFAAVTTGPAYEAARIAWAQAWGADVMLAGSGGSIPIVTQFKKVLNADSLLLGLALPDGNAHSPNESFNLDCYENGIRMSALLWQELAAIQ